MKTTIFTFMALFMFAGYAQDKSGVIHEYGHHSMSILAIGSAEAGQNEESNKAAIARRGNLSCGVIYPGSKMDVEASDVKSRWDKTTVVSYEDYAGFAEGKAGLFPRTEEGYYGIFNPLVCVE